MKNLRCLLLMLPLFLNGCSTIQSVTSAAQPIWPWKLPEESVGNSEAVVNVLCSGKDANSKTTCTETDALAAYFNATKYCRSVQNYYESGGKRAFATKTGIGILGTFSAIVMAPLSSGSAASAWTGLSGVANAAQTSLDEEFEKTVYAKRRAFIDEAAEAGESKYLELSGQGKPATTLIATAIQTARSCSTASAKADDAIFNALASKTEVKEQNRSNNTSQNTKETEAKQSKPSPVTDKNTPTGK